MMQESRILIVDDEPTNIQLLELYLNREHSITTAYNGREALDAVAQDGPFDLVLLDLMMPDIYGLDVLKQIREAYSLVELPVILISALSRSTDVQKGFSELANDYITKPFDLDIVQARVRNQLYIKQLTDERLHMMRALERSNAMRTRLMRAASHDMKNPLNNLNMSLELIQSYLIHNDRTDELINIALQSTETISGLVHEFLDMEIVQDEAMQLDIVAVDVRDVLYDVVVTYQYAANAKGIGINVNTPEEPLCLLADNKRLVQVLSNLLSNAIKYSPHNSEVRIIAERDGEYGVIHVQDKGPGIPEGDRKKLFKPFANINTLPTAGEDSSGLGLWIAAQMIEVQHGEIGLNTSYANGSDFWVCLPVHQPGTNGHA